MRSHFVEMPLQIAIIAITAMQICYVKPEIDSLLSH